MSYILDALRKADAERERGNVPGIHAQPSFGGAAHAGSPRAAPQRWVWAATAAGTVLAVACLSYWWGSGTTKAPPQVAAAPPPLPLPLPAPPVAAPPPLAPAVTPMAPAAAAVAAARPAETVMPKAPPPAPVRVSKPLVAAAAASVPGAATAEGRVYALNELPDDIRRQVPALSIGGSMYSTVPASRLMIINGQVVHEGERVNPELTLHQIRVKAAVFAYKGYLFLITF